MIVVLKVPLSRKLGPYIHFDEFSLRHSELESAVAKSYYSKELRAGQIHPLIVLLQ
jgi:hypothetical protein